MLTLKKAQTVVKTALAKAREASMRPLAVVVLDARGALKAAGVEDGASLGRAEIALGKARGALMMGVGSRSLEKMARERGHFITAATQAVGGLIPAPGGVLIRNGKGDVVGVVGISGDSSDNDESAATAGILEAGLVADAGQN